MKELTRYLLDNLVIDFQGSVSIEEVRTFLRADEGRDSKVLLDKLAKDGGVDDLLVTLADVLKEHVRSGVDDRVMRAQLVTYAGS